MTIYTTSNESLKFYVYYLIDPRSNKVFYVGEGHGDRAYTHAKFKSGCNNPHKDRVIRKIHTAGLQVIEKIVRINLTKAQAQAFEECLIDQIGLANLTNICKNANPPVYSGEQNGFWNKTHTDDNKRIMGDVNRGKDIKTPEGKASISKSLTSRWQDPDYREDRINTLKSRKGEKRSEAAIIAYKSAAAAREANLSSEEKSQRSKKAAATVKANNPGMKKQRYIDDNSNVRYRWIPIT